jgi:hypothetical protein
MLPNNLKYQPKVESAPARRYKTNIQPQNGQNGYVQGNTIIINIPTRNNTALIPSESNLKFTGTFTPSAAALIASLESCGHHGWINRLRVFHGSNLLQDIQEYHQLAKILYDFQMPNDSVAGRYSVTSGTSNEFTGSLTGADLAATQANGVAVKAVNRGRNFITTNTASAAAVTFNASINLISLVGALAGGKYLPLWEMTSAPLRVELVLQSSIKNVMCFDIDNTNGFTLNNVEFVGEFLELPDSAIGAIRAGSSNPLQMVVPDYRTYTFSQALTTSTNNIAMPIPAKFSSLKSIVVNQRVSTGATGLYPSASGRLGLSQYQFRIGSEVLPSTSPIVLSDIFGEAAKCFGSIADIDYQPSVDLDSYATDESLTVSATTGAFQASYNIAAAGCPAVALTTFLQGQTRNSGSFVVGIDCESYQNADKGAIFSGMNTNTSDIFYNPQYIPMSATGLTLLLTAFACYDSVLVCENGVAYSRY